MRSVLEYVISELAGPPLAQGAYNCPFCKSETPTLYLRVPKTDDRWRFGCSACPARGDLADFLALYFEDEHWGQRQERMAVYERQYKQFCDSGPSLQESGGMGDGAFDAMVNDVMKVIDDDQHRRDESLEIQPDELTSNLLFAAKIMDICVTRQVPPQVLKRVLERMVAS